MAEVTIFWRLVPSMLGAWTGMIQTLGLGGGGWSDFSQDGPRLLRVPGNQAEAVSFSVTQLQSSIASLLPCSISQSGHKPTDSPEEAHAALLHGRSAKGLWPFFKTSTLFHTLDLNL